MSVKKALKILDFLIAYETRIYTEMSDPTKSWNVGFDCMGELVTSFAKSHEDNVQVLKVIKKN